MHLAWLELQHFRSYEYVEFRPSIGTNVLIGENTAGKTNLLEAVAYLAALGSFRAAPDAALIEEGHRAAVARGEVESSSSRHLLEVELSRAGVRLNLNGHRRASSREFLGRLRVVTFLPTDLDMVKGGPAGRRDFIDDVAVQLWPAAHAEQREYQRVIRQRNMLLRQLGRAVDGVVLDAWDERMATAGALVLKRRIGALQALMGHVDGFYATLVGRHQPVEVRYSPTWGSSLEEAHVDSLYRAVVDNRQDDVERRMTTVGPHRDELGFALGDRDARHLASQGEQRCLALALRLATHQAIFDQVGEHPVLLLDDAFSELDRKRGSALVEVLPQCQLLVTSAIAEALPMDGVRWSVAGGRIV